MTDRKNVLIVGATGMVGGLALQRCLEDDSVGAVTVLGRRLTDVEHPKLREIVHSDFIDFRRAHAAFQDVDCALYCVGDYTGAVPDDEFRRITLDYTVAFADALRAGSPDASFCFLSGQGADQSEQSRIAFARYKGAAENALKGLGFPGLHIFRPGYIYPVTPREEPNFGYRVMRFLYPGVRFLYPNIGVRSDDLANAMVAAGLGRTPNHDSSILENHDIRRLAASIDGR